jgi:hypothetical protein
MPRYNQSVAYGERATYHSALTSTLGQIVFRSDMIIHQIYLANWKNLVDSQKTQINKKTLLK